MTGMLGMGRCKSKFVVVVLVATRKIPSREKMSHIGYLFQHLVQYRRVSKSIGGIPLFCILCHLVFRRFQSVTGYACLRIVGFADRHREGERSQPHIASYFLPLHPELVASVGA